MGLPRRARAKLGQNFLRDQKILKKIADFAQIEKTDTVVEVGPGEGTLTAFLLERAKKVIAVEKDEKLAELLKQKFKIQISNSELKFIHGDVLEIENLLEIAKLKIENYILVGNIPYYITGAIFKKFLQSDNPPESITFVVQKEVAERIVARDGKESILSISIKAYGKPEFGGIIKAGSFYPKPKVNSAVIAIRDISKSRFLRSDLKKCPEGQTLGISEKKFFEILKAGFAHKRKLLIKNLEKMSKGIKGHPLGQNSSRVPLGKTPFDTFKKCGISEKARAENLKVEDWICLTRELM